jgi:hypothetical protein
MSESRVEYVVSECGASVVGDFLFSAIGRLKSSESRNVAEIGESHGFLTRNP